MKESEFILMQKKGMKYCVDITLRQAKESIKDFIARAKRDDLGSWIEDEK